MARKCDICGRGSQSGNTVSHSHRKTRRQWKANIQKARVVIDGSQKTINICTSCLKSGKAMKVV